MVYGLQFIIVGEQEQFVVYGLQLTVYHSWRTRTVYVYSLWFIVYGLRFTVYHSWRARTVYDNVDGPTQNLSTKQLCIVVCALALYGMLPVVLYDGLRYA